MQSESEQSLKYKSVKMKDNCLHPIVHWHDNSHVLLKSCAPVLLRSHLPYPPSDPSPCHLDFLVISICYLFLLKLSWSNLATLHVHHCVWHGVPTAVLPTQAGRG